MYGDFTHETAFTRYSLYQILSVSGFNETEFYVPKLHGIIWKIFKFLVGILYHVESSSGIINNHHVITTSIIAKAKCIK